jgi:cephalosporin-C deacetylase
MRRRFKPSQTRPPDFDQFWAETRQDLEGVEIDLERSPRAPETDPELTLERISFASIGAVRVSGYLLRWNDRATRPLVFHSHGYGGRSDVRWDWARRGVSVCGVDIRGHGRSRRALPDPSPWGYILTGIESPEKSVLRGAVCDYMQAVRAVVPLFEGTTERIVLEGRSFAGALALMSASLLGVADLLAVGVPTFGWVGGRHVFVRQGSGKEVTDYLTRRPDHFEDVMLVLRYFDPINFADRVMCPTLMGIGLEDHAVPAKTVFAVANHLGGPHEIMEFPFSHSDRPEEKLWERFDERWIRLALEGVPPDFGAGSEAELSSEP